MARLSVTRQVAPGQAPGQFDAPVSTGAQTASRDLQQAGQAVQQAGQVAAAIWTKEAEQQNAARVNDALNQLQRYGQEQQAEYGQLLGGDAMQADEQGRPVGVVYGERMDQRVAQIARDLKLTRVQQEAYNARAGVLANTFRGNVREHELRQSAAYAEQVYTSGVATEQQNILANYDNPESVELAKLRLAEISNAEADRRGLPPEAQRLAVQTNIGAGMLDVVKSLADENVVEAEAFFEQHYEDMTAAQREDARKVLQPAREARIAEAAANAVAPELGAAITSPGAPADFDQSMSLIWPSEGTALVSDDNGAGRARYGITERSHPEAWRDGDVTQEEARQIYQEKYWKPLGLDELPAGLAHAAFDTAINMGAGAARDLLRQANGSIQRFSELRRARYRSIAANDADGSSRQYLNGWLERADRVEREALGQSPGVTEQKPTMTVTEAVRAAREALPEGAPPSLVRQTEALVRQRYSEFDRAEAQAFEAAQTAAFEWIEANGTMPPASVIAGLKPGTLDTIRRYHQAVTAPPTRNTDPMLDLALTADPTKWADMSAEEFVAAYGSRLSQSDLISYVGALGRASTAAGEKLRTDAANARSVPSTAFSSAVNSVFDLRGIDRTDLPDTDRQAQAQVMQSLRVAVLQEQTRLGRQMTESEIRVLASEKVAQLAWERPAGFMAPAREGYQVSGYDSMLPANQRTFRERLRARGNTNPSEAEVYEAYLLDRLNGVR